MPVIPNIQLIIIGEGEERKNLSWLAKKMEIDNLVWLVGEQEQLKKWLDSFDVFLALGEKYDIIEKSGSSYSYKPEGKEKVGLGRGYDAARTFLKENSKISNEILSVIKKRLKEPA